jgi:hypothetical protein
MSNLALGKFDIHCIHSLFTAGFFKFDGVTFTNFVDQSGNVNENVFTRSIVNDEAETLGFVEELDGSFKH